MGLANSCIPRGVVRAAIGKRLEKNVKKNVSFLVLFGYQGRENTDYPRNHESSRRFKRDVVNATLPPCTVH